MLRRLIILTLIVCCSNALATLGNEVARPTSRLKLNRLVGADSAEMEIGGKKATVRKGDLLDVWTLVEILPTQNATQSDCVVLEDYSEINGELLFVDAHGVRIAFPKSSEPTTSERSKLYLGHTLDEVLNSATDLLGKQILAKSGDPEYTEVAAAFEPIRKMNTYSFVGTSETFDKVGVAYGGRTGNFDPAPYNPPINQIREKGRVLDGLVGGYLPILRFVYPDDNGDWTEMIAFAPLRISNGNKRIQPVWYRVTRIENGRLKWAKYIDSYHPFPPRTDYDAKIFYKDLASLRDGWEKRTAQEMKVNLPDERLANMSRYALIREMMTRINDFPKYGAVDKDYAGSEHDGFPDTFTVDTAAMLDWGMIDIAGRYIDNYFGQFVRDDGSLLYRGPEVGQYGRMLTVAAQYASYGGNTEILLKQRKRIDGVVKLLLNLRENAKKLPPDNPAYGLIAGWSEADASLDADPARYMQPYFANSTEAVRGFRDLGRTWERIGKKRNAPELQAWGRKLQKESEELSADVQQAISRSILTMDGEKILPSIAGVKEPFHVVVARDSTDPQFRSYRAYMEMMYSGNLTKEQVRMIVDYRANHYDTILGVPTAYGYKTGIIEGFLAYGHGYGLIRNDMIREALLLLYSDMAHQYTRGTWTAPETRNLHFDEPSAPYCTPAELVVPMMTRWLLVFEDPESETLWLGKGIPRDWLRSGKTTSVSGAPTRWGKVGFSITSHLDADKILADVDLPTGYSATTVLRLRAPNNLKMASVIFDGKPWAEFDAAQENISFPPGLAGKHRVIVGYERRK